jgi:hypothetical protein
MSDDYVVIGIGEMPRKVTVHPQGKAKMVSK